MTGAQEGAGAQGPQGSQGPEGPAGADGADEQGSDATAKITVGNNVQTLSRIFFSNHTLSLGSSAGQYAVTVTPTISQWKEVP